MSKRVKGIYAVLAMLTLWCSWNSSNIGKNTSEVTTIDNQQQIIDRMIANMIDELEERDREEIKNSQSFNETFKEMRYIYGPGHVFIWNDKEYTTDYAEDTFSIGTVIDGSGKWVLNANDLDDFCKSNYHDECGTCDGAGALTWYLDRDGDGLGDGGRVQLSCNEPLASK